MYRRFNFNHVNNFQNCILKYSSATAKTAKRDNRFFTSSSSGTTTKSSAITKKRIIKAAGEKSSLTKSNSDGAIKNNFLKEILNTNNAFMSKPIFNGTNLATVCGHSAFFFMGCAYLTKDLLSLRLLAMSSMSLSMIFQYYRPAPLYMPLRWNSIFLAINCVMATLLFHELNEAEDMDEERQEIYTKGEFQKRGFSKVDFYRLFGGGGCDCERVTKKKGDRLIEADTTDHKLFYIVSGTASIFSREGSHLAHMTEHDFVGEIKFIRFFARQTPSENVDVQTNERSSNRDDESATRVTAEASTVDADFVRYKVTSHVEETTTTIPDDDDDFDDDHVTAVVESDEIVLYVWDFADLKKYLTSQRSLSNALFAYIGHELREKLEESWRDRVREDEEKRRVQELAAKYLFDGALSTGSGSIAKAAGTTTATSR